MKKKLLAAVFGAVLVLGACGGDKGSETETDKSGGETSTIDAEQIVNNKCISCHGGNLEGAMGPALDKIGGTLSEEEISTIIVDGVGGMPGGLVQDEAEVEAVAKWLADKK